MNLDLTGMNFDDLRAAAPHVVMARHERIMEVQRVVSQALLALLPDDTTNTEMILGLQGLVADRMARRLLDVKLELAGLKVELEEEIARREVADEDRRLVD